MALALLLFLIGSTLMNIEFFVEKLTGALNQLGIAVLVGICTHLGCSPQFRPEVGAADLGDDWQGGYFCPCHGSKFDLAGRVYKAVPAPTNLLVPPHTYESDNVLIIGVDEENA